MSTATEQYLRDRQRLLEDPAQSGAARRRALAGVADTWLGGLLAAAGDPDGVALAAVGGYGRRELSPGSDLDVVLLHSGHPDIAGLAEKIFYPVWDAGTKLDHSVRTADEVRKAADDDLRVHLGLLETRHVAGDDALTSTVRTQALSAWRTKSAVKLPALKEHGADRAERFGELAFLLEGDLKEARGGLRDAHALRAVSASWIADAPHAEPAAARETLLDIRDALHQVTGRSADRLMLQEQDAVARHLGLLDADTLLRRVCECARVLTYAADVTWREVDRVLAARTTGVRRLLRNRSAGGMERRPLAEGVVEHDGEAVLAAAAKPARDAVLLLRAAAAAAQAGVPLSRHAVERLAVECPPLPDPWPPAAREAFTTFLGAGRSALVVWEALESRQLISRLLPDWERVRNRPQRNAVHTWTVDRHLVETALNAADFTRRVARPDLLLVAALLHDIGKGWPGDHSVSGEVIAREMAVRMGFDKEDVEVLGTLVRHHLTLVDTATRRDPDDPGTAVFLAETVGCADTLDLLHALTEADAAATGPAAWSKWRAALVEDLVRRTHAVFAGRPVPPAEPVPPGALDLDATGLTVRLEPLPYGAALTIAAPDRIGLLSLLSGVLALHRLTVRSAQIAATDGTAVTTWTVETEFGSLPDPATLRADVRRALDGGLDVARKLAAREAAYTPRRGLRVQPPRVTVVPGVTGGATVLEVRAHDTPGLLHRIGRALADGGANVVQARVATLGADAVDVFYLAGDHPPGEARALARAVQEKLG